MADADVEREPAVVRGTRRIASCRSSSSSSSSAEPTASPRGKPPRSAILDDPRLNRQPCAGGERLSGSIAGAPSIPNAACVQSRAKLRNCFRCSSVRALAAHRRQSRAYL
jgi:hypothetical protein